MTINKAVSSLFGFQFYFGGTAADTFGNEPGALSTNKTLGQTISLAFGLDFVFREFR